jgi:hypothetical protein
MIGVTIDGVPRVHEYVHPGLYHYRPKGLWPGTRLRFLEPG